MLQRPYKICRAFPNEWDGNDPDDGWIPQTRGASDAAVAIRAGALIAALVLASFASFWVGV